MLKPEMNAILKKNASLGWVMEPEAKQILAAYDLPAPRFFWEKQLDSALESAEQIGYPLVAKVVSTSIVHKSDVDGVVVGVANSEELALVFKRFSAMNGFCGIHLEEMVTGVELIAGAKIDYQFGPVVLLGIGGTGVELYNDVAIRMAPLEEHDVHAMIQCLKGKEIIFGFRGAKSVNVIKLTQMMVRFSHFVMDIQNGIDSIDINPLFCNETGCLVGDARIMLARK